MPRQRQLQLHVAAQWLYAVAAIFFVVVATMRHRWHHPATWLWLGYAGLMSYLSHAQARRIRSGYDPHASLSILK